MKPILGTRTEKENIIKFDEIAKKYSMKKSDLLRWLILAVIKDDKKLMPIIMEIMKQGSSERQ